MTVHSAKQVDSYSLIGIQCYFSSINTVWLKFEHPTGHSHDSSAKKPTVAADESVGIKGEEMA